MLEMMTEDVLQMGRNFDGWSVHRATPQLWDIDSAIATGAFDRFDALTARLRKVGKDIRFRHDTTSVG